MTAGLIPCPVCKGCSRPCTRCLDVGFALSDGSVLTDQEIVRTALNNEHIDGNPFPVYAVQAALNRLIKYAPDDSDYSPAFQDEYQRLWHNARKQVEMLEDALSEIRALLWEDGIEMPTMSRGIVAQAIKRIDAALSAGSGGRETMA